MNIAIGCNLLTHQNSMAYASHMNLWHYMGKHFPEDKLIVNFPRRMSIDNMRNQTAQVALHNDCDFLCFYDDDVCLPKESIARLVQTMGRTKASIVAGLTYVRGYPFKSMAFAKNKDGNLDHISWEDIEKSKDDYIECDAIGFSLVLIDTKILKDMEAPYFLTGPGFTEDVYFCLKVKDHFPDTKIILDRGVQTDHIIGDYTISHSNHKFVKEFEENAYGAKSENQDFDPKDIEESERRLAEINS